MQTYRIIIIINAKSCRFNVIVRKPQTRLNITQICFQAQDWQIAWGMFILFVGINSSKHPPRIASSFLNEVKYFFVIKKM